jgi:hypothetical protein
VHGCSWKPIRAETKEVEKRIEIVLHGNGVDDEVERGGMRGHLVGVAGDDYLVGAEGERVPELVVRGRKATTYAPSV